MEENQELLLILARRIGSLYLSDLHTPPYLARALRAALEIEPGTYPISQWQEVAAYLLGWDAPLRDEAEARSLLAEKADEQKRKP